jgi:hypothetical protein
LLCYNRGAYRQVSGRMRGKAGGSARPRRACRGDSSLWGQEQRSRKETVWARRGGALPARESVERASGCRVAGGSSGRWFAGGYPCRAFGRSRGSAALGEKRQISLAHPPRVCPDGRRRANDGPAYPGDIFLLSSPKGVAYPRDLARRTYGLITNQALTPIVPNQALIPRIPASLRRPQPKPSRAESREPQLSFLLCVPAPLRET